jgi:D-beta-D-heptose 7-phosphate kinase/D-beta-D-heptose 1-phosphate adenosyltransferase
MASTPKTKNIKKAASGSGLKPEEKKEPVVVAVSGGFDPIHVGHVRMFQEAKKFGDKLVVILNNDHWLRKKKQHVFMPDHERKELISALEVVDEVVLTDHGPDTEDMSVCSTLRKVRPHIFANGGDRHAGNIPEVAVCEEIGAKMVFSVGMGGKVQSSSWLLKNYIEAVTNGNGKPHGEGETK